MSKRTGLLGIAIVSALVGCHSSDGIGAGDASMSSVDLASTCASGTKVVLNGVPQAPTDMIGTGSLQLSCCTELGTVRFLLPPSNATIPELQLTIAHYLGTPVTTPLHLELAALPKDWIATLDHRECLGSGSDPCAMGAASIERLSNLDDTFTGAVDVTGPEGARVITFCIDATAHTAGHTVLQSAQLVAHDVALPR